MMAGRNSAAWAKHIAGTAMEGPRVDRGDQQPRQFPAVMFLALVGESGDQCKVVKDITAHAATVAR